MKRGALILVLIILFFVSITLISAEEYIEDGYKYANYSQFLFSSKNKISCTYLPGEDWKTCEPIVEVNNTGDNESINKNLISKVVDIPSRNLDIYYTYDFEYYNESIYFDVENETDIECLEDFDCDDDNEDTWDFCVGVNITNMTEGNCTYHYQDYYNVLRKRFLNWQEAGNQIVLQTGITGLMLVFDVEKYKAGHFNVSVGSYTIDPDIDACGTLSSANTIYTLNQSVNSTGTCFNITANNVTLDCAGYWLNITDSGTTYAVYSDQNDTTVKNCYIWDVSGDADGITFSGVNGATIFNNTMNSSSSGADFITITNSDDINVTGNTGFTSGGSSRTMFYTYSSNNIYLNNNNMTHWGGGSAGNAYRIGASYLGCENVTIQNSYGYSGSSYTLEIVGSKNVSVINSNFSSDNVGIINFASSSGSIDYYNHTFTNCRGPDGGFVNYSVNVSGIVLEDLNYSGDHDWIGFAFSDNITIDNSTFDGSIKFYYTDNVSINDVTIDTSWEYGLYFSNSDYFNISDCSIKADNYKFYQSSSDYFNVSNITFPSYGSTYIYIGGSSDSNYSSMFADDTNGYPMLGLGSGNDNLYFDDIHLSTQCDGCSSGTARTVSITGDQDNIVFNNSVLINNRTTSWNGNSPSIYVDAGTMTNVSIYNSNLTNYIWADVYWDSASVSGTIDRINCTVYNDSSADKYDKFAGDLGAVTRQWYADTYVNDTAGSAIEGANVSITDVNSNLINWSLTNSSGYIQRLTLREYWQNYTATYYDTNYTFNGTLAGYNDDSEEVNLTNNRISGDGGIIALTLPPEDTTDPTATLGTNPIDNYDTSNTSVTFDFKCSDNLGIAKVELWGNWTGSWHANYTNSSYTNNTWLNITVNNFSEGTYIWGVYCNDSYGNDNWTSNRTFTISTASSPETPGASPGGTGSSGGEGVDQSLREKYFWLNNVTLDENNNSYFKKWERVLIDVNGTNHSFGVIDIQSGRASVLAQSANQFAVLYLGDERKFEVNGDSFYDVYVRLNDLYTHKVNLTVRKIHEGFYTGETGEGETASEEDGKSENLVTYIEGFSENLLSVYQILIIVLVIFAVIILTQVFRKKRDLRSVSFKY
ncbi:MAG: hypothetical protein JSW08_00385 [archaeon]|nr:MAG: hypothetical protein JSW08_00385 [archaeon]